MIPASNIFCKGATENSRIGDEAARLYGLGWSLFPLPYRKKTPGRGQHWSRYQTTRMPIDELLRSAEDKGNLAVVTGTISGGLAVRDYDDEEAYERWTRKHPTLAATLPTARTRRGYHVYFRLTTPLNRIFPDGELRGNNLYVVVPPSVHPDGTTYSWLIPPTIDNWALLDPSYLADEEFSTDSDVDRAQYVCVCRGGGVEGYVPTATATNDGDSRILINDGLIPTGPGQRHRKLWNLARACKNANPDASEDDLRAIFNAWYNRAKYNIRTKSYQTNWKEFVEHYRKVDTPAEGMLGGLGKKLRERHPQTGPDADDAFRLRIRDLCRALQANAGSEPFFLSGRFAANLVGCSENTARRILNSFPGLQKIEQGRRGPGTVGSRQKATYYRFNDDTDR